MLLINVLLQDSNLIGQLQDFYLFLVLLLQFSKLLCHLTFDDAFGVELSVGFVDLFTQHRNLFLKVVFFDELAFQSFAVIDVITLETPQFLLNVLLLPT